MMIDTLLDAAFALDAALDGRGAIAAIWAALLAVLAIITVSSAIAWGVPALRGLCA